MGYILGVGLLLKGVEVLGDALNRRDITRRVYWGNFVTLYSYNVQLEGGKGVQPLQGDVRS